jgi:diaminopimelate decarboxylase
MYKLNNFSNIDPGFIIKVKENYGTPFYLYDEDTIIRKCKMALSMPNAYGINVRYAMKANSNKTLLQIINNQGLLIDASSLNEVKRAQIAGIGLKQIMLTTQEISENRERKELEKMILKGLKYNICSLRQLYLIGDFAEKNKINFSIRIHPGIGSGESASRNTGDKYSCFGIHMSDIEEALLYVNKKSIKLTQVHVHIGSGGDPEIWKHNIDLELGFVEKFFPYTEIVSFGGGLKEARMPNETSADINTLGLYAKQQIEKFYQKNKRKLIMEIEPGNFVVANSGYVITQVLDKKKTGADGFDFIIVDGEWRLTSVL